MDYNLSVFLTQDDYFKRNLPPSYGFDSVFSDTAAHVSKGFQELDLGLSSAPIEPLQDPAATTLLSEPPAKLDYTNLSKNLSVFESLSTEPTLFNTLLGRQMSNDNKAVDKKAVDDLNNNDDESFCDEFRYQNITTENLGYTGSGVDVKPYGIARLVQKLLLMVF